MITNLFLIINNKKKVITINSKSLKRSLEIGSMIQGFLILPDYLQDTYKLPEECYDHQSFVFQTIPWKEVRSGDYVLIQECMNFERPTQAPFAKIVGKNDMHDSFIVLQADLGKNLFHYQYTTIGNRSGYVYGKLFKIKNI